MPVRYVIYHNTVSQFPAIYRCIITRFYRGIVADLLCVNDAVAVTGISLE